MAQPSSSESRKSGERARQRYRYIRYLQECRGGRLSDLWREFCLARSATQESACHFSVFHRVCRGERTSLRIRRWIARRLRVRYSELWS